VKVIGLVLETARDPVRFRAALEKAANRGVPVVVLKLGRTAAAAAAALTHTGAMAGSDLAYEALFDHYGVVRVETLDELACSLLLFSTGRRARAGSLVSIHDSGGECEMFIDLAQRAGVAFAPLAPATKQAIAAKLDPGLAPTNPLDAWGTGNDFASVFAHCFTAMLADENAALGIFAADVRDHFYLSDGLAAAAIAAAAATDKPVVFVTNYTQLRHDAVAMRLTDAGVPVLDGTHNGLVAVRGALAVRDFRARPADPVPDIDPAQRQRARVLMAAGPLDEAAGLALLAAYDVPVVAHRIVDRESSALAAAAELGYPVVLKTAQAGILHKTEAGGVHLDLADAAAVRRLWSTVRDKVRERNKVVYAMFDSATVRAIDGDTLVLVHPAPTLAKRLTEQHNAEVIREALKDVLGVNWRLRCEVGVGAGEPGPAEEPLPPEPQPDPVDAQRAEEDELIAEAVRDGGDEAAPRRDPEEVALELLQSELGARRIDG
ncbi:MAG: acetate--CoA ligase family protein, partial [Actinomycetes bacterium]